MLWTYLKLSFYIDTKLNFEDIQYLHIWSKIDSQVLQIFPSRLENRMNVITFPKTAFITVGCKYELALNIHNLVKKQLSHNQGKVE